MVDEFVIGDVTNSAMRQMVTAAAEGSIAAKGVHEFLMIEGKN